MLSLDHREALEWARMYRQKKFNPLPSCMDQKRPTMKYAHLWETLAPAELFTEEGWPATCNIQVVLGAKWRLLAVDLDGGEARDIWERWSKENGCPDTWTTSREGGESRHLWFKSPKGWRGPIAKRFCWRGPKGTHSGIEVLGDKSLIVAPPSRHVKTGGQYRFASRKCSPDKMGHPADAPPWIMNLPAVEDPAPKPAWTPPPVRPRDARRVPEVRLDRDEILGRILDKRTIAIDCGLKLTGRVSHDGWAECHAYSRPDVEPSAAVNIHSGWYVDKGEHVKLGPLDLMVATGRAHDWRDALDRLSHRY